MKLSAFRAFLLVSVFIILSSNYSSFAQVFQGNKDKVDKTPPKALLIKLNTNQRKKEYFTKTKNTKMLKQVNTDTDSMIHKIVTDFTDNFHFCPVYYFIDTNEEKVKAQNFTGVLLDKNLKPVASVAFEPSDNYFIATYGVPNIPQASDNGDSKDLYDTDFTNARGKTRLLVMDKHLQPLQKPLPDGSNSGITKGSMKKPASEYKYTSPKFDISYKPVAAKYQVRLESFYKTIRK